MVIRIEKTKKGWIKNAHLLLITYIFHKEPIFLLAQANKNKKPLLHKIVEMIGPWQCEAVFQNSHLQGLREVKFRWVPSRFLNPGPSARWLPQARRSHTAMGGGEGVHQLPSHHPRFPPGCPEQERNTGPQHWALTTRLPWRMCPQTGKLQPSELTPTKQSFPHTDAWNSAGQDQYSVVWATLMILDRPH